MSAVAGIFVGGRAERMGGAAKGLLAGPDGQPIIERLRDALRGIGLEVVLVGRDPRYDSLGLQVIEDEPGGIGPLGGLIGLLRHAGDRVAVAIACDMPFVDAALVRRLLAAPAAPIVAPRRGSVWEPLFARYDAQHVLPVARKRADDCHRSLQGLLRAVGTRELTLVRSDWAKLRDWDTPADVASTDEPVEDVECLVELASTPFQVASFRRVWERFGGRWEVSSSSDRYGFQVRLAHGLLLVDPLGPRVIGARSPITYLWDDGEGYGAGDRPSFDVAFEHASEIVRSFAGSPMVERWDDDSERYRALIWQGREGVLLVQQASFDPEFGPEVCVAVDSTPLDELRAAQTLAKALCERSTSLHDAHGFPPVPTS